MKMKHKSAVAGLLLVLSLSAGAEAGEKLDDARIFAIFDQANATDVWIARIGLKQARSEEVRALARMVATDHEVVQQMGRDLAKKLDMIPVPPDQDASAWDLAKAVALLQSTPGPEFDKAYLRHEIVFHQSVIEAIKGMLLPAVKNDALRELLKKVLPGFEHHLAATQAAARKLGVN